jgi:hypothetical protein
MSTADRVRGLSWQELEQVVAEIVARQLSDHFITRGARVGSLVVDVFATPDPAHGARAVAIDVKRVAVVSVDLIMSQVGRRDLLRAEVPSVRYILATNGGVTRLAREAAKRHELEVWDSSRIADQLSPDLSVKWFGVSVGAGSYATNEQMRSEALALALATIEGGKPQALEYQKWVRDVMEYLFVPPLGPVHYESADAAEKNRRDVIFENWASDGFWAQLRAQYAAEQVVVDAKNSAQPLGKRPVIEIAHYLKAYGCGLFGVLCCRHRPSDAAKHAIREQWIGAKKLVLALSDDVMLEMLALKAAGSPPEELLRREIGRFRIAL